MERPVARRVSTNGARQGFHAAANRGSSFIGFLSEGEADALIRVGHGGCGTLGPVRAGGTYRFGLVCQVGFAFAWNGMDSHFRILAVVCYVGHGLSPSIEYTCATDSVK